MALVANARMYAVTPEVAAAWQTLFAWVARAAGIELAIIEHAAPAPLEHLWSRDDLGAVFMCGFPFASAEPQPQLLAAPVPLSPRYCGEPSYCTDFVVREDRPFRTLQDCFGGRIGWTVHHSQSGYNAVRYHLHRLQQTTREGQRKPLFAEWVGPLVTPRAVVEAVLAGRIDVGPLDSLVRDLLERHEPATMASLRTVGSTAMTPVPPLIASRGVPIEAVRRLREALLSCGDDSRLRPVLDRLGLRGFAAVAPQDYTVLLEQAAAFGADVPQA
jgi:ABC-type phosphate/phosphonate transport system substrate-binding protein